MIKTFFITIIFIIGGEQRVVDGWYPLQVDNYERCQEGSEKIKDHFISIRQDLHEDVDSIRVSCSVILVPASEA